jgi:hypothetical protein
MLYRPLDGHTAPSCPDVGSEWRAKEDGMAEGGWLAFVPQALLADAQKRNRAAASLAGRYR